MAPEQRQDGQPDAQEESPEALRQIRQDYRNLIAETAGAESELAHSEPQQLQAALDRVNDCYTHVRRPQEAALDARVLLRLSALATEQIRGMKLNASTVTVDAILGRLEQTMLAPQTRGPTPDGGSAEPGDDPAPDEPLDWSQLADLASSCLSAAPPASFLFGPLEAQRRDRAPRERVATTDAGPRTLTQPTELTEADIRREKSGTSQVVQKIYAILQRTAPLPFFRFFVNASDYAQSVENLFYVSFLVKDGRVRLYMDGPHLMIDLVSGPDDGSADQQAAQMVFGFTHNLWQSAIEVYGLTEPTIPTRRRQTNLSSNGWYGGG